MKPTITIVVFIFSRLLSQLRALSDGSALMVLSGNNSSVSTRTYRRIESATEWKSTWLEHLGLEEDTIYRTSMEIDLKRCDVIAIFEGETFNSCGFKIESVREDGDTIALRFSNVGYQTAGPDGGADRVSPYAFVVLPKSEKTVVLEEMQHSLNPDERSVSREVARLKAGKQ